MRNLERFYRLQYDTTGTSQNHAAISSDLCLVQHQLRTWIKVICRCKVTHTRWRITSSRTCRKDLQTEGRAPACALLFPGPSQTISFSPRLVSSSVSVTISRTGWSLWRCEGSSSGEPACAPPTLIDDRVSRSVEVSRLEMIREAG